jgi:DNA mismatch endonuclease Vsr
MQMHKTKEQISYNMSRVKSKDSKIEIMLRKELWARGLRYQKNSKKVFGKPDIVFIGKKILEVNQIYKNGRVLKWINGREKKKLLF